MEQKTRMFPHEFPVQDEASLIGLDLPARLREASQSSTSLRWNRRCPPGVLICAGPAPLSHQTRRVETWTATRAATSDAFSKSCLISLLLSHTIRLSWSLSKKIIGSGSIQSPIQGSAELPFQPIECYQSKLCRSSEILITHTSCE